MGDILNEGVHILNFLLVLVIYLGDLLALHKDFSIVFCISEEDNIVLFVINSLKFHFDLEVVA